MNYHQRNRTNAYQHNARNQMVNKNQIQHSIQRGLENSLISKSDVISSLIKDEVTQRFIDIIIQTLSLQNGLGNLISVYDYDQSLDKNRTFNMLYNQLIVQTKQQNMNLKETLLAFLDLLFNKYNSPTKQDRNKQVNKVVQYSFQNEKNAKYQRVEVYDIQQINVELTNFRNASDNIILAKQLWGHFVDEILNLELQNSNTELTRNYNALSIIYKLIYQPKEIDTVINTFQINNNKSHSLVSKVSSSAIQNYEDIKYMSVISKYLECQSLKIYLEFKKFQNINQFNKFLKQLLDNLHNRLAKFSFIKPTIIVRQVENGMIWQKQIPDNDPNPYTSQNIERLQKTLEDIEVDIIIYSPILSKLNYKIRCLSYVNNSDASPSKILLYYPENLISVTLYNTTIQNLNECISLENIFSQKNTYSWNHIKKFKCLQRIYSCDDSYDDQNQCLLEALLLNNKPSYIFINSGINTTKSCILNKNIEKLRFFQVRGKECGNVKFDLECILPEKLLTTYQKFLQEKNDQTENDIDEFITLYKLNESNLISYLGKEEYQSIQTKLLFMKKYFIQSEICYKFIYQLFKIDIGKQQQEKLINNPQTRTTFQTKEQLCNRKIIAQKNQQIDQNALQYDLMKDYLSLQDAITYKLNEIQKQENNIKLQFDIKIIQNSLRNISPQAFFEKFASLNDAQINIMDECLTKEAVYNESHSAVKCLFSQLMDCSLISFNSGFSTIAINDQTLLQLFENIENRIQCIQTPNRVIIIRTQNGTVYTYIDDSGDKFISSFIGESICDVIICGYECVNVGELKIRYLNYVNKNGPINLTLKHPEAIKSLSIEKVTISNLSQCRHLVNLCSVGNTYNEVQIQSLSNLERLYSNSDRFSGAKYMLEAVLQVASLQYAHIIDSNANKNPIKLEGEIQDLRYVFYETKRIRTYMEIHIQNNYPQKLRVLQYVNDYEKNNNVQIIGDRNLQLKLQQQLIQ